MRECTRCGVCCSQSPCTFGSELFGYDRKPCPALIETNGKNSCGLVMFPSRYIDIGGECNTRNEAVGMFVSYYIGIGCGCCSSPGKKLFMKNLAKLTREEREMAPC